MCGIFGMIARGAPVPPEVLERATQSLAHRGPDDGGTVILHDDSGAIEIGLGNRRLAILDLSPLGHQPMTDPATGNWIVYNGEIYNFREVRNKLQQAGHHFISLSDTEVILRAYAHWGEKCVDQFRGMFAFAIWDARQHRLFAARDPMGIKPFYFYQSDRYFLFSSEVRTLLGTGLVPRNIDPAGLVSYLSFGSLYEPNTLLEGVRSLAPGHFMTWAKGEVTLSQYWDLIDSSPVDPEVTSSKTREARESEIAQLLDESVRMQLVSDVPVGVFLSGGIDSSVLVEHPEPKWHQARHVLHCFSRSRLLGGGIFTRGRAGVSHRSPGNQRFAGRFVDGYCAGSPRDGSADHRWHQHLLHLREDAGSWGEGRVIGPGGRRNVRWLFQLPHRPTHAAVCEGMEPLAFSYP